MFTVQYIICWLYGRAASVSLSCWCTPSAICICCQASLLISCICVPVAKACLLMHPYLRLWPSFSVPAYIRNVFAAFTDEAAAENCSHWSAAYISAACWLFVAGLEDCCCLMSFGRPPCQDSSLSLIMLTLVHLYDKGIWPTSLSHPNSPIASQKRDYRSEPILPDC